jgi:phosphatidylserine decarboxylase
VDTSDSSAHSKEILQKLASTIGIIPDEDAEENEDLTKLDNLDLDDDNDDDDEIDEKNPETSDETDNPQQPERAEKRRRKLRLKRLKKRAKARAYEFTGGTNVVGVVFLEVGKITDLPPERNSRVSQDLLALHGTNIVHSDKDWLRYGPLRGGLFRPEDVPDSSHQP